MIVKPSKRLDWFTWRDPPLDWCKANAELPGLQAGSVNDQMIVDFHVSHLPCLPQEVRDAATRLEHAGYVAGLPDARMLRGYQQIDRAFLHDLRGALLCYQMRMGKSPLACHLHDPRTGILVIVGPLAAREVWREWIERTFHTGLCCLAGRTNVEHQPGYPAYFCHYDVLGAHTDFFQRQRIGTLVLDECHQLQGRRTQRLSAVNLLAPRAGKILGLTGTPMWNKPKSLYSILHLIMPGAWGSHFQFCSRYAGPEVTAHGFRFEGASNTEELKARLDQVMVRRTWAEVMPELPPTTRIIEPVELTGAQLVAIEAAAMKASLARGTTTVAGYRATLRRKLGDIKVKPAVEDALRAAADGHKVVLWCWHNEVAGKVVEYLTPDHFPMKQPAANIYRLRSADSASVRDENVRAFRNHDGPCFMVANIGVGGVALDLSCSDYAIFVELDWTPANVQQAEMRTFHKDRPHVLVFLEADCPTETALVEALDIKNGFAAALGLGADDVARKVLE